MRKQINGSGWAVGLWYLTPLSTIFEKIFKCEKLCAVDNDDDEGRHKMMTHDKLTTQKSES
jgi:hypothetical protein